MKKILITGSTGLVGSEAVKFFSEKGWEVHGIDANMRSYFFGTPKKQPQYEMDIRDQEAINGLFSKVPFDAVIHTAAQPSHDWSKKEPLTDFDINARGTLILLEAVRNYCPHATFVHVSTDKVYGENMKRDELIETETRWHHDVPFDESIPLDTAMRSLFGASKTAADIYVQEYGYYFGINTACFRPGCITGKQHEGSEYHGFLAQLARCIKNEETFNLYGFKGKQVRDQVHAHDLVNAFYHFIEQPKIAAVYNIGGGPDRSVSVWEAIALIEKETGKKAKVEYFDPARKGDRQWDVHDVSKFRKDYPQWDYQLSLQDIIKELCQK
jgi:CDP-paratose 2-epimerase